MKKIKEFLQDNKKTIILAFVGSAILLAYYLIFYFECDFINNKIYLITVIVGFAFQMIQTSFFSSGEILLSLCSFTVVPYFYNYYELSKNK